MTHYRSNLRDIEFNLFEMFDSDERWSAQSKGGVDVETARSVVREVDRLARGPLADSFADSDRHPPVYDPDDHSVTMPESFAKSYEVLLESDWWRLNLPEEWGGTGVSPSLRWAANELLLGANPALFNFVVASTTNIAVLGRVGNDEQKRWARLMLEHKWGGAVALTEPDAGSDVGAGRTRAVDNGDGTWSVEGVKRFITSGENDLVDNIIFLVLARPEGAKPGTKGLSMFLVPKFFADLETGELGRRNGVRATNLEKKMGLKASPTCEMTFGADEPAIGWLVGDVHEGIAQIFHVMEFARMSVGTKAIAALSSGYRNAVEYARTRVQGADLVHLADKSAPRVTIMHHPDVRRSLLLLKSYSEGLRALVFYSAHWLDELERSRAGDDTVDGARAQGVSDLLLPIVKGVGSERSYEMLAVALQTYGGSGFLQDYPIEQYLRDTKIDSIYEGTTAIQAMDLFFRKMSADRFTAFEYVATEIERTATGDSDAELADEHALLAAALADVRGLVAVLTGWTAAAQHEPEQIYRVGLNATRLLMAFGDLLIGWLLLCQAEVALAAMAAGSTEEDFYLGKVEAARWFAHNRLPLLAAERAIATATDLGVMRLPEGAF